jgi:hypothetical protein
MNDEIGALLVKGRSTRFAKLKKPIQMPPIGDAEAEFFQDNICVRHGWTEKSRKGRASHEL